MPAKKVQLTNLLQLYPLGAGPSSHSQIIVDLLQLGESGKQVAVDELVVMLDDLHFHGHRSRFIQKLRGLPLYELKPSSRRGHRGGARVYFTFTEHGEALSFNAECKSQGTLAASSAKLEQALEMLAAFIDGKLDFVPHKGRW